MKQSLALIKQGFESSSYKTSEFLAFASVFKKEMKKLLHSKDCHNIVFSVGHFYISGFFTNALGQIYYFSISDVRGLMPMPGARYPILYRTAKSYSDYSGGSNCYANMTDEGLENFHLKN